MKPWRIFLALYLGFVLSALLLLIFSASGLRQFRALTAYRDVLIGNIEELRAIQRELAGKLEALRTDREHVTLQARELGFYREGERAVRMSGSAAAAEFYRVGRLVQESGREWRGERLLRMTCLLLPIPIYGLLRTRRRKGLHANRVR